MKALLDASGYSQHHSNDREVIEYDAGGTMVFELISVVIGIAVLVFAAASASWKLALLGVILVGAPFTSHKWRLPRCVIFNHLTGDMEIHYLIGKQTIASVERPELAVDYFAKSSFVSPFQEGYQDHYYTFQAVMGEKRLNLFRIKSRTRIDELIQKMVGEIAGWKSFSEA